MEIDPKFNVQVSISRSDKALTSPFDYRNVAHIKQDQPRRRIYFGLQFCIGEDVYTATVMANENYAAKQHSDIELMSVSIESLLTSIKTKLSEFTNGKATRTDTSEEG